MILILILITVTSEVVVSDFDPLVNSSLNLSVLLNNLIFTDINEEDENAEENGSNASEDNDDDEYDEEYEDRKEPKSVEELKIRAFHLAEKKERKKTLAQERNQQQGK